MMYTEAEAKLINKERMDLEKRLKEEKTRRHIEMEKILDKKELEEITKEEWE